MLSKIERNKRKVLFVIAVIFVGLIYLYQISRPTVVFHTHIESGYLGKVSKIDGCIDKLYTKKYIVKYRLPHIWNWNEEDEIAIFTTNYLDLFKKENLDFWRQDIYLDKNGYYESHSVTKYFWMKNKGK